MNWLTVKEAAELLRVSTRQIHRYLDSGELEFTQSQIGLKKIYIPESSAKKLLKLLRPV